MTISSMARWKKDVEDTLNEFNRTASKQSTAIEDLRDMFEKFMSQTKVVRSGSPSASKSALENEASTGKRESRKRARKQLATRAEVTLSDNDDLPVQQPSLTPIPKPIPQRKWKVATHSHNPAPDCQLGRVPSSLAEHEVTDITSTEATPVAPSLLLPVGISGTTEVTNHEVHEVAADTSSPAENEKSHNLTEDEVMKVADSTEQCGKTAEDSHVYSMEEDNAGKVTSLGGTADGDVQCSDNAALPP